MAVSLTASLTSIKGVAAVVGVPIPYQFTITNSGVTPTTLSSISVSATGNMPVTISQPQWTVAQSVPGTGSLVVNFSVTPFAPVNENFQTIRVQAQTADGSLCTATDTFDAYPSSPAALVGQALYAETAYFEFDNLQSIDLITPPW